MTALQKTFRRIGIEQDMADREDILLKEYELCQEANQHVANHYWLVVGVFMSVNTAILAAIAYGIMSGNFSADTKGWLFFVAVLVLGLGIIFILYCYRRYLIRVDFQILMNYERMRDIEIELDMWKNWRIFGLDNFQKKDGVYSFDDRKISEAMKTRLTSYRSLQWWEHWKECEKYMHPVGEQAAKCGIWTLMFLWVAFILIALASVLLD
jgi:hypothetical protein